MMLATTSALAQSAGQWQSPPQLWNATCFYCHESGVTTSLFGRQLPTELIRFAVRNGLTRMPPFAPSELNDQELEQLAAWINTQPAPKSTAAERSP